MQFSPPLSCPIGQFFQISYFGLGRPIPIPSDGSGSSYFVLLLIRNARPPRSAPRQARMMNPPIGSTSWPR